MNLTVVKTPKDNAATQAMFKRFKIAELLLWQPDSVYLASA